MKYILMILLFIGLWFLLPLIPWGYIFYGVLIFIIAKFIWWLWLSDVYKHRVLGLTQYHGQYLKPSGGIAETWQWFKTDKEALEEMRRNDFIYRMDSENTRIKPS